MTLLKNVLGIVVAVVVIYLVYGYFSSGKVNLSGLQVASKQITIDSSKLPTNKGAANYTYSIWFYVNEWGPDLSKTKPLLIRGNGQSSNPSITLAPYENNIDISVTTYPTTAPGPSGNSPSTSDPLAPLTGATPHSCTVRNFPLQKWVNLIVCLNGRTLDVYIDGKLVRTCILPGVPKPDSNADVLVTPGGGFSGWTSNLQYFANPLNPQEAYNIYKEGPGSSGLMGFFEKYKIKIAYLVDNKEEASVSI